MDALPTVGIHQQKAYRLVNSKFPPIGLFDDVADAEEFDALYALQALTNPRLKTEIGLINLVAREDIPFGIPGCSYAIGPFTHINPEGSRFSDGQYGVLYMADTMETAIAEVRHHQVAYWLGVKGLDYDRFVFRGLTCEFDNVDLADATSLPITDPIYDRQDYSVSRSLGRALKKAAVAGLHYRSVRRANAVCWGLLTPRPVTSIIQMEHYEFIWSGGGKGISSINQLIHKNV